jgi:hypothetical protein
MLHGFLEFRHAGGRKNHSLDPAVFCVDPKQDKAIPDQRPQGMTHGGQIHQQTVGEPGHGRVAEGMYLREQAILRLLHR